MASTQLIPAPSSDICLHGVLLEIFGAGTLLCGASGIGKSELALELISRGHRLVADDAPQFTPFAPDKLKGTCPPLLRNFLAVRDLGVLNVQSLFGSEAVMAETFLQLIVNIESSAGPALPDINNPIAQSRMVLGINILEFTLPVIPGRNLAVLTECLVRNHLLQVQGYHAADNFSAQHTQAQG